jgi:hypothetical protein
MKVLALLALTGDLSMTILFAREGRSSKADP